MAMSKKEFEMLASNMAAIRPDAQSSEYVLWAQACMAVSDVCRQHGPNFDSGKFRHACMDRPIVTLRSDAAAVRSMSE